MRTQQTRRKTGRETTRGATSAVALSTLAVALLLAACGDDDSAAGNGATSDTAAVLGPDKPASGEPVKIGFDSVGQNQATDTTDEIRAAQAVVAYANAKLGGLAGRPIELVVCEDKNSPASAQACGNQFVSEKVSALVVGSTGQIDPVIKITSPAGIPAGINLNSTAAVLTTEGVFVWGNPLAPFGTPAAYARDNDIASAAIVVVDVPAAAGAAKALAPGFFTNAGSSAQIVAIPHGTADMTPQIQAAEQDDPAMYHIIGDPAFCTTAISAIKTLGVDKPITAIDRCLGAAGASSIPGGYEGVTVVSSANVDPDDAEYKLFAAVVDAYGEDGLDTAATSQSGYQAMLGFVRAVNAAGASDVSPTGIRTAIESMPATHLPLGGGATFQCNGQAVAAISKNICTATGFAADAASDGSLSNFRTLEATDIYQPAAG